MNVHDLPHGRRSRLPIQRLSRRIIHHHDMRVAVGVLRVKRA